MALGWVERSISQAADHAARTSLERKINNNVRRILCRNVKHSNLKDFIICLRENFLLLLFDPFPCVLTAEPLSLPLAEFLPSRSLPVCEAWSDTSCLWWWHYWSLQCAAAVCWGLGILSTVVSRLKSTWQVNQVTHFKNNFKAPSTTRSPVEAVPLSRVLSLHSNQPPVYRHCVVINPKNIFTYRDRISFIFYH